MLKDTLIDPSVLFTQTVLASFELNYLLNYFIKACSSRTELILACIAQVNFTFESDCFEMHRLKSNPLWGMI
jgi:hypothetical protein